MHLTVTVADNTFQLDVPQFVVADGESFFQKLDADMDGGWQMHREYVENPNVIQRCQIVADRLLTAMHQDNRKSVIMLAGYIVSRLPHVTHVKIDDTGNMQSTRFEMAG